MQLLFDIGGLCILGVNVVTLVALKGFVEPQLAGMSLSLTVLLLGLSSYWGKSLA